MNEHDWNPGLYLKYRKERNQPPMDLISKIGLEDPGSILDVGCGPGNSTIILARRWPGSKVVGIDSSPSMIEKARNNYPDMEWRLADALRDDIPGIFDLVFSNAAIQWIPEHYTLLKKFKSILTKKGILAVQLPLFFDMPVGKALLRISSKSRWAKYTENVTDIFTIHSPSEYYDLLTGLFSSVEIWETHYFHVMDSHDSIIEMISSTGLRPYLERLENDSDKKAFKEEVADAVAEDYRLQKDGMVLFPFNRLFFIAKV
jgi:trans-aconitate 2-methyltransferase